MIYLDYAATSLVKPQTVYYAVNHALRHFCANPGRGGHDISLRAGEIVYETREKLGRLFGIEKPERLAFFPNTTYALNAGIKGVLGMGDHVVVSSMEHNSVLRPLAELKRRGIIDYTMVRANQKGELCPWDFARVLRPNTRLVVCTHVSNVCGNVYDIAEISHLVRRRGTYFMVDAAQSAGVLDIDVSLLDLLAFPGHKGLYGPQGTAGLYVREGVPCDTIIEGGTGSQSELLYQPEDFPDRLESGTLNVPAIAGLGAAADFILKEGTKTIRDHERYLTDYFIQKIQNIPGLSVYGSDNCIGVVALNIKDIDAVSVADCLNREYGIAVRSGLHCAPAAHRSLGTLESGCVRFSFGYFTTKKEVEQAVFALNQISKKSV